MTSVRQATRALDARLQSLQAAHQAAAQGGHDQAQGLRRLFEGRWVRALGVVSNPHVAWSGLLIEHLTDALAAQGQHPLVVDAAETAAEPDEWTSLDLRWSVNATHPDFSYLGARGLVGRRLLGGVPSQALLKSMAQAAPWADVLLVHAPADDLARLFAGQPWQPTVLADTHPDSLMHAYAALKQLSRWSPPDFNLLMDASRQPVLGPRMAVRLSDSARHFLSWSVAGSVVVQGHPQEDPVTRHQLTELLRAQLAQLPPCTVHRHHAPSMRDTH